ncbi:MAG: TIGR00282 family metallophosphoesterase [Bacteroidetes bacterium]|nr:TIGR00282 family metallophosphoesterase [Bacteroidota bacterium]
MSNKNLNILFIGDIVGAPGFEIVQTFLKGILEKHKINFCIANGENLADGKGLTEDDAKKVFSLGVDVITTGNHVWDRWDSKTLLSSYKNILRPINYPKDNAGFGFGVFETKDKIKVGVINAQGRTFMQPLDDPFKNIDFAISKIKEETKIIILDFHAEATSEKIAMGWYLDGRASALIGTHTHTPTADLKILPAGLGYITDAGMTGPFDSVIGMRKDSAIQRFLKQTPYKYETAVNDVHFCGVVFRIDIETGNCKQTEQIIFPEFSKSQ